MKIAIYSRKSKFSPKGESIENQVNMCKEYAKHHFQNTTIENFLIYEDEGFSGGNTNRPEFKRLLTDIANNSFNLLICYRLDRISRNVSDFSSTLDLLQNHNIDFVSITEQFDTTTPMGRAMIYISSVFAQLERETIAERVKDNMMELAKMGRWLGGSPPLGFSSKRITFYDENMKERSMVQLTSCNDELELVKLIFYKYLQCKSLAGVESFLLSNYYKTRKGSNFTKTAIKRIITNSVYVKSSTKIFNYLSSKGITVCGKPDNKHGILTYNKLKLIKSSTGISSRAKKDTSEWISAIGKHEGIISDADWLEAQKILNQNKNKSFSSSASHNALLTGILRCGKCGGRMKIVYGPISKKTGKRISYYACELKKLSKGTRCDNINIKVSDLDPVLINVLKETANNTNTLLLKIKKKINQNHNHTLDINSITTLKNIIKKKKLQISNLAEKLSLEPNLSDIIIPKIYQLKNEISETSEKLNTKTTTSSYLDQENSDSPYIKILLSKCSFIDTLTNAEKKLLIRGLVKKVTWNGTSHDFNIELIGSKDSAKKSSPKFDDKLSHISVSSARCR